MATEFAAVQTKRAELDEQLIKLNQEIKVLTFRRDLQLEQDEEMLASQQKSEFDALADSNMEAEAALFTLKELDAELHELQAAMDHLGPRVDEQRLKYEMAMDELATQLYAIA